VVFPGSADPHLGRRSCDWRAVTQRAASFVSELSFTAAAPGVGGVVWDRY